MKNEEIEKNESADQPKQDAPSDIEAIKKARRDALVVFAKSKSIEIAGGVATALTIGLISGFLKKNIEARLYAPTPTNPPVIIDQVKQDKPM